ncbi:cupredoxin domain-containing protein [Bosea sp. NBC_00550]|uniref:cupredoxin domain-containing protein n=1 Tax=Bosea sp. NBC_00550 TaxID=2969621 RepID=UPI00222EFAE1|nr:cupredoxin domain-containing protein [Bosea sp. NBC_00550]UZF95329.1 cupredoxin domain-containing protein [Bosea sp. NBC_00550]
MLVLFLAGGRREQTAAAAPRRETRHSPRLRLAGTVTLLLVGGGVTAFVYAAATGSRRAAEAGTADIAVAITDRTCEPATLTIPAGKASFVVTNRGERVLEWEILDGVMVLEERENIAPGQSRRLTTQLHPGEYAITCGLLSAPRGRLIVQASTIQPRPALTLMDMVGPAAEYRAFLSERSAALGAALDALEQAESAGDAQGADKARRDAVALLPGLRPATAGDAELETLHGKVQDALAGDTATAPAEIGQAAEAFRAALGQRTILPDTMLAGAIALLSPQDAETVTPEGISAARDIARLLLPLTARIDPDLAARTKVELAALAGDARPRGAILSLSENLAAMRRALALPETERKS